MYKSLSIRPIQTYFRVKMALFFYQNVKINNFNLPQENDHRRYEELKLPYYKGSVTAVKLESEKPTGLKPSAITEEQAPSLHSFFAIL